jgi:hypothetical protein
MMNARKFVIRQLSDLTNRSLFVPFAINLLDGTSVHVSDPLNVTFLHDGVFVTESGGTERVFSFEMICSLSTLFVLPPEKERMSD